MILFQIKNIQNDFSDLFQGDFIAILSSFLGVVPWYQNSFLHPFAFLDEICSFQSRMGYITNPVLGPERRTLRDLHSEYETITNFSIVQ